jgi:hypothetical protein
MSGSKARELMETGDERGAEGARWTLTVLLALIICAAPALFWGQALRSYFLHLDDFVYLSGSRTGQALRANLLRPHNAHVVPLFRVETFLLASFAGTLAHLPAVLGMANYVTLLLAMLATGYLVGRETGRPAVGLAAMAAVGLSTVMGPAILRYSSGQALMSGTLILLMLIALQAWRRDRGWPCLVIAVLAAIAASLCWSAGYAAGPASLAYLWGAGKKSRLVGMLVLAVSLLLGVAAWSVLGPSGRTEAGASEGAGQLVKRIPVGLAHTARAIPEALVLNNLGLDARTEGLQGWALCLLLGSGWYFCTLRSCKREAAGGPIPSRVAYVLSCVLPLEAAGAMLVLIDFGMIYTARGNYSFENVRALGWYHAIPQLGAVLFAAGWLSGRPPRPLSRRLCPPAFRELFLVVGLVMILLLLQSPRADRVLFDYDGAAAPVGGETAGAVHRTGPASQADLIARATGQRQALERLDRLERIARRSGIGRSGLREVLGRFRVPGMPEFVAELDAISLLRIPERGTLDDPDTIRAVLSGVLEDARP